MQEIEEAMLAFGIDEGILEAALEVRKRLDGSDAGNRRAKDQESGVSLCMVVKNEEKGLRRCLMSAKPLVDEMIVVDTDSTDNTKAIDLDPDLAGAFINYSLSEFCMGNVDEVVRILQDLLWKKPGYPPAKILLAAAPCTDGEREKRRRKPEGAQEFGS